MSKKSQPMWRSLTIGLMLVFGFVALNWWEERPKQMLSRFLNVNWSNKITKIESNFIGGLDFTAHIYLEADVATVDRILAKNNFAKTIQNLDYEASTRLNFKGAPDARSDLLIHYEKNKKEGTVWEYAATTSEGMRLWYAAYDY
jgi:hypothetical protein